MQVEAIADEMSFVNQIGQTLSIEERMRLEIVLHKLKQDITCDDLRFWGRVEGTHKNYYIAVSHVLREISSFPKKTFYFTTSEFSHFSLLPSPQDNPQLENLRTFFVGDIDHKVLGHYSELDRLSALVHAVERNCQIVPKGAYLLTASKELRLNKQFKGLNPQTSNLLESYLHFREPQQEEIRAVQMRDDAIYNEDFLENCKASRPQGQWSVQSDSSQLNVTVRNLLWPGYLAYHRVNSKTFGGIYFGNGIKNSDLEFILP